MINNLDLYNKILFISPPWLEDNISDHKYQQLLQTILVENYAYQPKVGIKFFNPLTPRTKYYHNVIKFEAIRYLNALHNEIINASNENEKKYLVHKTLARQLKKKFAEIEKIITTQQLYITLIDNRTLDRKIRDDAFIIQLLKYELIHVFLETQNNYTSFWPEDVLSETEIHSIYFSETPPENSFLKAAPDLELPKATNAILIQPQEKTLVTIKGDIREVKTAVLLYNDIVDKQDLFAKVEAELNKAELLDDQYCFIKKRGNVEKMAAIVHLLIQKKYFIQYSFTGGRKPITDLQIRKFLNHRYITDIDKEFRVFKKIEKLETYLGNHLAMRLIFPS